MVSALSSIIFGCMYRVERLGGEVISSVMDCVVGGKMSIVVSLQYMTKILVLYNQQWLLESHYVYPASIRRWSILWELHVGSGLACRRQQSGFISHV